MTDRRGLDLTPAMALFRSLGDPARLAIVRRLAEGEARVVDLTRVLGLVQSTVSKHVACLRDCGLVAFRVEGRQSFHSLTRSELIELTVTVGPANLQAAAVENGPGLVVGAPGRAVLGAGQRAAHRDGAGSERRRS